MRNDEEDGLLAPKKAEAILGGDGDDNSNEPVPPEPTEIIPFTDDHKS